MGRLILFALLLLGLLIVFAALMSVVRSFSTDPAPQPTEDTMPNTFRSIAYGLLIFLMFGVTIGWLGAG